MLTQVDGPRRRRPIVGSVIYSLGLAPVVILATDLIVGSAPVERAGAASAISETSSELGGALGIAILGSIGTAVYRSAMANAIPMEVPSSAVEAVRSTLGGAVAVAEQLPQQHRDGIPRYCSGRLHPRIRADRRNQRWDSGGYGRRCHDSAEKRASGLSTERRARRRALIRLDQPPQ